MTFTQRVKANLTMQDFGEKAECRSEVYAFLLFSSVVKKEEMILECSTKEIKERFKTLLKKVFNIDKTDFAEKNSIKISGEAAIKVYDEFFKEGLIINEEKIENEKQLGAFLRGAYLAVGSSSDPEKEYRLEFSVKSMPLCISFLEFLSDRTILLSFNQRRERYVAYTKDSSLIEDLFVLIGAGAASLEIMNAKIERDITNKINRVMNCDSANMRKTEKNAEKEISAINYVLKNCADILSDELLAVANLRLQNPESSISELCSLSDIKLSRSGMYHRLKKIVSIAQEHGEKGAKK